MRIAVWFAHALLLAGCSGGPRLGRVTEVVITGYEADRSQHTAGECERFTLTAGQAQAYLNRAVIISGYEMHDFYSWLPCAYRGTAKIRDLPAIWEIRGGGTGLLTVLDDEYVLADERQRQDEE